MKKSFGSTDTPISGVTAPSITLPVLNFDSDYRVKKNSDSEVVVTNITTNLDQPESIRFGVQDIKDIYANAGLSTDQIVGSRKGVSLVVQLNTTLKVTSDDDSNNFGYYPISAHLVLKVPNSGYITASEINAVLARLNGALYDKGNTNIMALLKGAVNPKGL